MIRSRAIAPIAFATSRRRSHVVLPAAALLAGLLLRLWLIARFSSLTGDTLIYGDIARNWLQHGVYGFTQVLHGSPAAPRPTLIRLPGYPLFLAACFHLFGVERYSAVLFVQAAVDLVTCCLLAGVSRRLFGSRAGMAALWLAVLCPFTACYVAAALTETLTLFCIALAFYALLRWQEAGAGWSPWFLAIASALGYAILLRPEQGILAASVAPAMVWISWAQQSWAQQKDQGSARVSRLLKAAQPALAVSLLSLLPLLPWTLRNERTFHRFQPLAPRFAVDPGERNPYGFQRWYRTWAIDFASTELTYWPYEGEPLQIADLPNRAFDSDAQYAATDALLGDYNLHTTSTPALDARFNALARQRMEADPIRYFVLLPVARVLNMIFRPRTALFPTPLEWWKFRLYPRSTLIALALAGLNLGYLLLAALAFRRRRSLALNDAVASPVLWALMATIVLRCALLLTLDNSEPRYTLEFFPVAIVLAAGFVARSGLTPGAARSESRNG